MTEEKLKRAEELKIQIDMLELVLQKDIKGIYYDAKPLTNTRQIELDYIIIGNIKRAIETRLKELRKAFEEL